VFQSPLLNCIWQLLPIFILCQVWKERNRRLFRDVSLPWQHHWNQCRLNILETLNLQLWNEKDLIRNPSKLLILQYWKPFPPSHPPFPSSSPPPPSNPSSWSTPLVDFIKLNFDGASKGNLGTTGYGVVFRNHLGHILLINVGSLGHTMNNAVELWGLIRGLQLAIEHNFTKLIVEGDSQIIINLFSRLLNGADPERISPSWRLSHGLKTITDILQPNQAVIPTHIRRKVNQVADELDNLGTNWVGPELLCKTSLNPDHPIL
jgi:ribonuclease HI